LQDVFDLAALKDLLTAVRSHAVRIVDVATDAPSPFACSLQLKYVSAFMYEGDAPLAERRAQALVLDRAVLAELMGREELRALLDAGALADVERELQHLTPERQAQAGGRTTCCVVSATDRRGAGSASSIPTPGAWLDDLARSNRALCIRVGGEDRWIAAEDAARSRCARTICRPECPPRSSRSPIRR
jgi:ATP-dependent Lhr-like helicase